MGMCIRPQSMSEPYNGLSFWIGVFPTIPTFSLSLPKVWKTHPPSLNRWTKRANGREWWFAAMSPRQWERVSAHWVCRSLITALSSDWCFPNNPYLCTIIAKAWICPSIAFGAFFLFFLIPVIGRRLPFSGPSPEQFIKNVHPFVPLSTANPNMTELGPAKKKKIQKKELYILPWFYQMRIW